MLLGDTWQCSSTFEDPDPSDTLTFSVKPARVDWAFYTDDGIATFIPNEVGEFTLRVQVKDNNSVNGSAGNLKDVIYLTITVYIENTAPEFTAAIENQSLKV